MFWFPCDESLKVADFVHRHRFTGRISLYQRFTRHGTSIIQARRKNNGFISFTSFVIWAQKVELQYLWSRL